MVTRSTDGTSDEIVINLSNANYSIDRGENPDGGADGSFNLEINGETLEFTATPGSFFPLVATGGDGTNYELRPNTGSVFSSTNLISIIGGDDEGPFGLYTFGFETNPANLPTDGSVNYAGELAGETFSDGEASSITGSVRFTARFGDSRILGDASVNGGDGTFEFDILETNIVGNGFTTTTTLTNCPDLIVCAPSATQIGGTFFGPDGSEISGLAVIDETIAGDRIIGAAGYTATRQTD
ncbi:MULTISPECIES: transferrin-binding protein-like solute binding protein [unclassified Yoonia]|uniref:transferrin-binding protein-like solute binding protein n=1 Tax=unclassified Yoonia TaxID=2629118 RepID=UPI002AFEC5A5|nr:MULTISPECIES: transferrin-binding protein-like solute binding protein [unclassified Yoonia]